MDMPLCRVEIQYNSGDGATHKYSATAVVGCDGFHSACRVCVHTGDACNGVKVNMYEYGAILRKY